MFSAIFSLAQPPTDSSGGAPVKLPSLSAIARDTFASGVKNINEQKYDEAIKNFTTAIKLNYSLAQSYHNRALAYARKKLYDAAILDYNESIKANPKYAAAFYGRGLAFYYKGDNKAAILDYSKAIELDPKFVNAFLNRAFTYCEENRINLAEADEKKALALGGKVKKPCRTGAATSTPTAKTPTKTGWNRMTLTGTGLSVESPQPFTLVSDKPDPFLEDQTAKVFWRFGAGGVFATVTYEKTAKERKTPRQKLDETAALFAETNNPTLSRVTDTTFLGQTAAVFEEEFVDQYDPKKLNLRRKMITFGSPGELTTVNITYPINDANAKTVAGQIFDSVKKEGAVAETTSKMPPTDWKRFQLRGLIFETPTTASDPNCGKRFSQSYLYESTSVCYKWNEHLSLDIGYRKYSNAASAPAPSLMAQAAIEARKEVDKDIGAKSVPEFSVTNFPLPGGEAVKLKTFTGYGTVGTIEERIFVRRGGEIWEVRVNYFIRWDFTKEAAERIVSSIKF